MYAKYNYTSGATLANIAADVIALLTGTVLKASLSAGCDAANTEIYAPSGDNAGYAVAGWTVHDAAAGTNKQVLKAAVVDDAAFYKYVMVDYNTAGYMQLHLYETWDAGTHAGTNQATAIATTGQQRITVGTGATLAIGASARYIMMQSITAAGIGASEANEWTGVFERSRLAPWDTVGNAYPPSVLVKGLAFGFRNAMFGAACPRYKNPVGGDFTGANATLYPTTMGWCGYPNIGSVTSNMGAGQSTGNAALSGTIKTKVPDGAGGFYTPFNEIQFRDPGLTKAFEGGSISGVCDVWNTVSYPNNLDEVTKGSTNYIIWQNTGLATVTAYATIVGNASANTVFPKG
jgi:hypothetical protein